MNWLNTDWKKYLEKNDRVLLHTVVDNRVARINSILGSIFIGLVFSCWCFPMCMAFSGDYFTAVFISLLCFFALSITIGVFIKLSFRATHYVLTTKGVYKISGLIYKHVKFVPYNRITDAEMTCGLIGHICDTANIGVCTASSNVQFYSRKGFGSENEIDIKGIRDYEKVRQLILGKIK